jgi:Spy/CpxP family protein refolding chaperone
MKWLLASMVILGLLAPGLDAQRNRLPRNRETPAERKTKMLTERLSLSAEQKEKALALFAAADKDSDPIDDELSDARRQLRDATRRGAPDSEIEQLASRIGTLLGRKEAIQAKADTAFHGLLTPEQRDKLDRRRGPVRKRKSARV